MNEGPPLRTLNPWSVLLPMAIGTVILGIAVLITYVNKPPPVELIVMDPVGTLVLCDLVIDGEPATNRGVVPVKWTFHERDLRFAVIPEDEDTGSLRVVVQTSQSKSNWNGRGVIGTYAWNNSNVDVTMATMSREHVASMRAARDQP